MTVKLMTEHHLEFLNLNGGCTGSSEFTHVKMPYCWKSYATAQIIISSYALLSVGLLYTVMCGLFTLSYELLIPDLSSSFIS